MKITPEQRQYWASHTQNSPFNRWLSAETRGEDGHIDLDRLHALALKFGIDKRAEYAHLNVGQQRMNIGNSLRAKVSP